MPVERYVEMPFGRCPYCGHTWQIDDWYFFENGHTLACPKCEKTIVLVDKDITTTFTMRLEGE